MARLSRIIALDTPHHITQRGNARRFILDTDSDRFVYLQLLRHYVRVHDVHLLGYCLMSNHVHLVAAPRRAGSLALALKYTHGRYAAYFNTHISPQVTCGRAVIIPVRWTSPTYGPPFGIQSLTQCARVW